MIKPHLGKDTPSKESEANVMGASQLFVTLISLIGGGYIGLITLVPVIFSYT